MWRCWGIPLAWRVLHLMTLLSLASVIDGRFLLQEDGNEKDRVVLRPAQKVN